MAYFPIFTQIDGKRCLIAGGGKVAARKVYTLLQYGADVVVMAEKVCGEIKEVLPEENVFEGVFKYIHKLNPGSRQSHLQPHANSISESKIQ